MFRIKRLLDLLFSISGLVILSPMILLIVLLIRLRLSSPVIFYQRRQGLYGNPFKIYKFRTMSDDRDSCGNLLPDEDRLTAFGRFLRSTSMDELPEIINVLRGDMSLVGPRPLLMEYLDRYTPEQDRRHEVQPGITGWAQINGRNNLSWEDKFKLDVWYVDNWTLGLDLKIFALTLMKIFSRDGINQPGQATAEKFRGSVKKDE